MHLLLRYPSLDIIEDDSTKHKCKSSKNNQPFVKGNGMMRKTLGIIPVFLIIVSMFSLLNSQPAFASSSLHFTCSTMNRGNGGSITFQGTTYSNGQSANPAGGDYPGTTGNPPAPTSDWFFYQWVVAYLGSRSWVDGQYSQTTTLHLRSETYLEADFYSPIHTDNPSSPITWGTKQRITGTANQYSGQPLSVVYYPYGNGMGPPNRNGVPPFGSGNNGYAWATVTVSSGAWDTGYIIPTLPISLGQQLPQTYDVYAIWASGAQNEVDSNVVSFTLNPATPQIAAPTLTPASIQQGQSVTITDEIFSSAFVNSNDLTGTLTVQARKQGTTSWTDVASQQFTSNYGYSTIYGQYGDYYDLSTSWTPPEAASYDVRIVYGGNHYFVPINSPSSPLSVSQPTQFDFSFSPSPSPSSQTVTAGGSTSYQAYVQLASGQTQSVSLSCSPSITGVTYSFAPQSSNPTFTSTLTVQTSTSTPSNTYTLTITGTGGGQTHTTTVQFIVIGQVTLGIVPKSQHKDTPMLCLKGCSKDGNHAWDSEHQSNGCTHDNSYCVRAGISMINSYYGGSLSQDRISYHIIREYDLVIDLEDQLGHGRLIYKNELEDALQWALGGVISDYIGYKPAFSEIRSWIDSGRPILRRDMSGDWHATIIDGYDLSGEKVHLLDPGDGSASYVSYSTLVVWSVWVSPSKSQVTPRNDESTLRQDSDNDGVCDFDEINRFRTDPLNADTDGDGVPDKAEIISYTFLADGSYDLANSRRPDPDGDGKRCELDKDSDGGGTPDGLEDRNHNGVVDPGETDPLNPSDDALRAASVMVVAHSPINLLVTDPNCRRIGYDPISQSVINEIPGATYSGPGSEPQNISIPNSINGTYIVNAIGTASGPYTIHMDSLDVNGSVIDGDTMQGTAIPGVQREEEIRLDPDGIMILQHDLEVESIRCARTTVGQGYVVSGNSTVANRGNCTETFNVTIYANKTAITTLTAITLASEESAGLSFVWNTTGFALGDYNISVVADNVSGETDISDNTCIAGTVHVGIPGDVTGDGYVGTDDIFLIATHFGQEPGQPDWNPIYDIAGDNYVGIDDIFIAASHFGQEENP